MPQSHDERRQCNQEGGVYFDALLAVNGWQRVSAERNFLRSFRFGGREVCREVFREVCREVFHEVFGLVLL